MILLGQLSSPLCVPFVSPLNVFTRPPKVSKLYSETTSRGGG